MDEICQNGSDCCELRGVDPCKFMIDCLNGRTTSTPEKELTCTVVAAWHRKNTAIQSGKPYSYLQ